LRLVCRVIAFNFAIEIFGPTKSLCWITARDQLSSALAHPKDCFPTGYPGRFEHSDSIFVVSSRLHGAAAQVGLPVITLILDHRTGRKPPEPLAARGLFMHTARVGFRSALNISTFKGGRRRKWAGLDLAGSWNKPVWLPIIRGSRPSTWFPWRSGWD